MCWRAAGIERVEEWNGGMLEEWMALIDEKNLSHFNIYSNIPFFHHSVPNHSS
jgi:hypothetical protein